MYGESNEVILNCRNQDTLQFPAQIFDILVSESVGHRRLTPYS